MATLTLRLVKGTPLTNQEVDDNFSNLNLDIGVLTNLTTSAKSNIVSAINELQSEATDNVSITGGFVRNVYLNNVGLESSNARITSGTFTGGFFSDANLTSSNVSITGGNVSGVNLNSVGIQSSNTTISGGNISGVNLNSVGIQSSNVNLSGGNISSINLYGVGIESSNATFNGPVVISTATGPTALRVSHTGTGNVLVLEDENNPDTTPLIVSSTGNVSIGTGAQADVPFEVKDTISLVGSSSGYVRLKAAAAAGSTTFTLPTADGSPDQVLKTDGAGTLSWVTPASSSGISTGKAIAMAMIFGF